MATILYIEDDAMVIQIVKSAFRNRYNLISAQTAHEGLELVQETMPNLVLLDLGLPNGMDGWQVASAIRQDDATAHIPLIAISAQTTMAAKQAAFGAGCDAFIEKPFTISELLDCVQSMLVN